MSIKRYQFSITVAVHDPSLDQPAVRDEDGRVIQPKQLGVRHEPPGTWVEIEEEEAERIIARHGRYNPDATPYKRPSPPQKWG